MSVIDVLSSKTMMVSMLVSLFCHVLCVPVSVLKCERKISVAIIILLKELMFKAFL